LTFPHRGEPRQVGAGEKAGASCQNG
jgi:hypothetical protein